MYGMTLHQFIIVCEWRRKNDPTNHYRSMRKCNKTRIIWVWCVILFNFFFMLGSLNEVIDPLTLNNDIICRLNLSFWLVCALSMKLQHTRIDHIKRMNFIVNSYILSEQSHSWICRLQCALFTSWRQIHSNFNHVNGLAVNNRTATFVIYCHCSLTTMGYRIQKIFTLLQ